MVYLSYIRVDMHVLFVKIWGPFCHSQAKVGKAPPAGVPKDQVNIPDPVPAPAVVGSQDGMLAIYMLKFNYIASQHMVHAYRLGCFSRTAMCHILQHVSMHAYIFPCQPVTDLESYMGSLEKKLEAVHGMIGKLKDSADAGAKKFFDCIYIDRRFVAYSELKTMLSYNICIITIKTCMVYNPNQTSISVRLHTSLTELETKMEKSYENFGSHLTELKLDHREGAAPSERLDQLLGLAKTRDMFPNGSIYSSVKRVLWILYPNHDLIPKAKYKKTLRIVDQIQTKQGLKVWYGVLCHSSGMILRGDHIHDDDDAEDWLRELLQYNRQAADWNISFDL